jgi:hypothetical protein
VLQIFAPDQQLAFELQGASFKLQIGSLQVDVGGQNREVPRAVLMAKTAFIFTNSSERDLHGLPLVSCFSQKGQQRVQQITSSRKCPLA